MRSGRKTLLLTLALLAAPLAWGAADAEVQPCPGFQDVPHQGPSCPVSDGWLVRLSDGTWVLTHGPDPAPPSGLEWGGPPFEAPPRCVPTTADHNHVIYAHPSDKPNRSVEIAPLLRTTINRTNGLLLAESLALGGENAYKMLCEPSGLVHISAATLATPSTGDSFQTIVSELRLAGYTHPRAKYWVWYDDGIPGVGGQATWRNDDRLIANNSNMIGPDFAITYGYMSPLIMMHENGHNLGAVQNSAPHSSGGAHCNDGRDIMCYADGGSTSNYTSNACSYDAFDCNHDTYYHPAPPAGSYLATHWNLGHPFNRWFDFGPQPPVMFTAHCPSAVYPGAVTTCTFGAYDKENVAFEIDWGDGSPVTRLPASGGLPPGQGHSTTHVFPVGTYTMEATPLDEGGRAGTPLRQSVHVAPNRIPTMRPIVCTPAGATVGQQVLCDVIGEDPEGGRLTYELSWGDGHTASAGPAPRGSGVRFGHWFAEPGVYTLRANATDDGHPNLRSTDAILQLVIGACDWTREGALTAGAGGIAIPELSSRVEGPIPSGCQGKTFALTSALGSDFDVCWLRGTTTLRCDQRIGNESGIVPLGADHANVVLRFGIDADYTLHIA